MPRTAPKDEKRFRDRNRARLEEQGLELLVVNAKHISAWTED